MLGQKTFYIGKADINREQNSQLPGPVARFQEHVLITFKSGVSHKSETRYRVWRFGCYHEFTFLPFSWGNKHQILSYERFLINYLQAPIQDRVRAHHNQPAKFRLWPRLRLRLSVHDELRHNCCFKLLDFQKEKQ